MSLSIAESDSGHCLFLLDLNDLEGFSFGPWVLSNDNILAIEKTRAYYQINFLFCLLCLKANGGARISATRIALARGSSRSCKGFR